MGRKLRIWSLLAGLSGLFLASPVFAQAQNVVTVPASRISTDASGTIAVTDAFQQLWAAQSARVNCAVQNNGGNSMWVYAGSGTATKGKSIVLPPGALYNCAASGVVTNSAIWVTGTASDAFYAVLDGAPSITTGSTAGSSGSTTDVNVTKWGGAATTLGAKTSAASVPVTIASDQASFPVTVAAGSAIIGNVRIDQTTPGTTNGVVVNSGTVTTVTTLTGTTTLTPGTGAANLGKAEDAAAGSGDTGVAAWAIQTASPADAATDGDYAGLQMKNGGLYTTPIPNTAAGAGITTVKSSALESNHVIKNSAGNLYGFQVTTGATAGWVLVYNGTTAPTAGGAAVAPEKCYIIGANTTIGVAYTPVPLSLSTGIVLVFSSSGCLTNTASSTVFFSGDAK